MNEVFSSISASPVAAASLGQVYRGVLSPEYDGHEVAIKVRRPQVLESVGLDLYLMRQVALYLRSLPQVINKECDAQEIASHVPHAEHGEKLANVVLGAAQSGSRVMISSFQAQLVTCAGEIRLGCHH